MRDFFSRHKVLIITLLVLYVIVSLILTDFLLWNSSVSSNKDILQQDSSALLLPAGAVYSEIISDCRVDTGRSPKAVVCEASQDIVIRPARDIVVTLESVFVKLNNNSWDSSFDSEKTELLRRDSRFGNQCIEFHKDSDQDYIEVCRVDNGNTLAGIDISIPGYDGPQTDVIALKLRRHQKASVTHVVVSQFKDF